MAMKQLDLFEGNCFSCGMTKSTIETGCKEIYLPAMSEPDVIRIAEPARPNP